MQFKFNECDIVALCRNVIDMVEKIKQTQAEVRFSTSLSSLKLTTDSARLQQVLINLLINAQLGGKIWIDPDYDKGARFLFTHPICHAQIKKEETR